MFVGTPSKRAEPASTGVFLDLFSSRNPPLPYANDKHQRVETKRCASVAAMVWGARRPVAVLFFFLFVVLAYARVAAEHARQEQEILGTRVTARRDVK